MAEWSNAAVLKTVEGHTSGGSNPSFSATKNRNYFIYKFLRFFISVISQLSVSYWLNIQFFIIPVLAKQLP